MTKPIEPADRRGKKALRPSGKPPPNKKTSRATRAAVSKTVRQTKPIPLEVIQFIMEGGVHEGTDEIARDTSVRLYRDQYPKIKMLRRAMPRKWRDDTDFVREAVEEKAAREFENVKERRLQEEIRTPGHNAP